MTSLYHDVIETPFGWMGVLASPAGLKRMTLPQPEPDGCVGLLGPEAASAEHSPERFEALAHKLRAYFGGGKVALAGEPIAIDDATPFMRAAWQACRSIPLGETRSYGWLAARAGAPKASRAAGQAMAKNRLPIVVPCHRVVAGDGGLRGFGEGAAQLDLKRRLLDLEAAAARR
jgi:methylated-DNA-[protein]-cysteine S-methyltransferase